MSQRKQKMERKKEERERLKERDILEVLNA